MPRRPSDGLDQLDDQQLRDLAGQYNITAVDRATIIQQLRDLDANNPFSRTETLQPEVRDQLSTNDRDESEREDIQGIVDDYDNMRQPGERVEAWQVTLSSGNRIIVYSVAAGMIEVEADGYTVYKMGDDDMVSFDGPSTVDYPRRRSVDPTPENPRRKPSKLPGRRIGRHQAGNVVSMEEQRSKLPQGESTMPSTFPSDRPAHFPRHRKPRN